MCGRTCVGVTSGKKDRTHALRTHVLEFILHAQAHVRPHIARVRVCTHLRNPYLAKKSVKDILNQVLDVLGNQTQKLNWLKNLALVYFSAQSHFFTPNVLYWTQIWKNKVHQLFFSHFEKPNVFQWTQKMKIFVLQDKNFHVQ